MLAMLLRRWHTLQWVSIRIHAWCCVWSFCWTVGIWTQVSISIACQHEIILYRLHVSVLLFAVQTLHESNEQSSRVLYSISNAVVRVDFLPIPAFRSVRCWAWMQSTCRTVRSWTYVFFFKVFTMFARTETLRRSGRQRRRMIMRTTTSTATATTFATGRHGDGAFQVVSTYHPSVHKRPGGCTVVSAYDLPSFEQNVYCCGLFVIYQFLSTTT